MLRQEMQAKDISWAESLSGASRSCSNRVGKSEQTGPDLYFYSVLTLKMLVSLNFLSPASFIVLKLTRLDLLSMCIQSLCSV